MLTELLAALLVAEVEDDEDATAAALPEVCAPEVFVCAAACVWDDAPAWVEAVDCAAAVHAPRITMASNESIRFI
jgi:hypothetical protein